MTILSMVNGPRDLKVLSQHQLTTLAEEIRSFLVENVSRTGGHLGPNLGVVELTIALHRVFNSPRDTIVFDTGHQSYVHKILTGRTDFAALRQAGGLSGYPSRAESGHDVVENSHATTALSWADGIARGLQLRGIEDRRVVAVIGDGAMTGGMAWEALNNIAEDPERPVVIVLNDNGRSYAPTIGGMVRRFDPVRRLDTLRVNRNYEQLMDRTKRALQDAGTPGKMAYGALHSLKKGVKDIFIDAGVFDSLGLKYIGPVDGHDMPELEEALTLARDYGGPVVVHAITEKGRGYKPAEEDEADRFHAIGAIHPETGLPIVPERFGWTSVFAEEIRKLARQNASLVGITAAMLRPVGLGLFKDEFPSRVIDVGIAEQHALTMAAGLAFSGFHPVVALYATFLNRGFDQMLMDVALHKAPVTICLDRAGITGNDGASHNGMWDLSLGAMIPGLRVAAPRDGERLRELLGEATQIEAPTLLRYPKGEVPDEIPALHQLPQADIIYETFPPSPVRGVPDAGGDAEATGGQADEWQSRRIAVVAIGVVAQDVIAGARQSGCAVTVFDPRWVLPVRNDLAVLLASYAGVVTVEDGVIDGGVGSEIAVALAGLEVNIPVEHIGVNREFIPHAPRSAILAEQGLTPEAIAQAIRRLARKDGRSEGTSQATGA
ncbi:MAG: 1-deoxy-D-xylulose-5-phosphate synthase [Actinomycetaceae bacterium]|nr:1-deoxy-D-xylulose-5-phosphate synthase [Actinomycetaceae bacterium]